MHKASFVPASFLTNTLFHFLNIYPYILTSSFSTSSIPLLLSDYASSSILQPPHASLFESAALAFINSCLVFIAYSHNKSRWALPSMQGDDSPFFFHLSFNVRYLSRESILCQRTQQLSERRQQHILESALLCICERRGSPPTCALLALLRRSEPNSGVNNCTKRRRTTGSHIHTAVFQIRIIDFAWTFCKGLSWQRNTTQKGRGAKTSLIINRILAHIKVNEWRIVFQHCRGCKVHRG